MGDTYWCWITTSWDTAKRDILSFTVARTWAQSVGHKTPTGNRRWQWMSHSCSKIIIGHHISGTFSLSHRKGSTCSGRHPTQLSGLPTHIQDTRYCCHGLEVPQHPQDTYDPAQCEFDSTTGYPRMDTTPGPLSSPYWLCKDGGIECHVGYMLQNKWHYTFSVWRQ